MNFMWIFLVICAVIHVSTAKMCGEGCGPMETDKLCAKSTTGWGYRSFESSCSLEEVNCESHIIGGPKCKLHLDNFKIVVFFSDDVILVYDFVHFGYC